MYILFPNMTFAKASCLVKDITQRQTCYTSVNLRCIMLIMKTKFLQHIFDVYQKTKLLLDFSIYFLLIHSITEWINKITKRKQQRITQTCMAGAQARASIKHIMHMSSASCLRLAFSLLQR